MPLNRQNHSPDDSPRLLRARAVLPVTGPPIPDGAVRIAGRRIESVSRWSEIPRAERSGALDLGEVILLPGLINAHCHLDYTGMAGQISPPRSFVDWLKLITTSKAGWLYSEFAESWLAGARMLLRTGTTTVGDIEMVPELLPEVWSATPLRVHSFLEMTGVKSRRPPAEILGDALTKIAEPKPAHCQAGLSPHAPYSTAPELLRLSAQAARQHGLRVTVHVAESGQEFEMYTAGKGVMHDWLARGGRDMSDCGLGSPVRHLERCGALDSNLLAVHVNYLAPGDAVLLGQHQVSVAHCPRSHAYFKHDRFPQAELAAAGVNVCLGTDSLASVQKIRRQPIELSMFEEIRAFSAAHPAVDPAEILRLATVNGATALGMRGRVGELSPKACADLIVIPGGGKIEDCHDAVLQHRGDVFASMIGGRWVVPPSETP